MAANNLLPRNFGDLRERLEDLFSFISRQDGQYSMIVTIISCFALFVTTRIVSGWLGSSTKAQDGTPQPVPLLPYWVPVLGHLVDLVLVPDRLLKGTRLVCRRALI